MGQSTNGKPKRAEKMQSSCTFFHWWIDITNISVYIYIYNTSMYIYMYLYICVCVCTHTREPIWIATSRLEFTNLTESLKDLKLNIARTHKKIKQMLCSLALLTAMFTGTLMWLWKCVFLMGKSISKAYVKWENFPSKKGASPTMGNLHTFRGMTSQLRMRPPHKPNSYISLNSIYIWYIYMIYIWNIYIYMCVCAINALRYSRSHGGTIYVCIICIISK